MTTQSLVQVPPSLHPKLRPLFTQMDNALPPFRQSTLRLVDLISTDTTSATELSKIIINDPGLSSRVLRLANSLAYSPTTTITTVHHAVVWLGLENLRTIVGTIKLLDELLPSIKHSTHLMRLITSSIMAAAQAGELGAAIEYTDIPNLYTRTLLHNMVDMMLVYQAPELYESLLAIQRTNQYVDETDELSILGVTRRQYGYLLAQLWHLPGDFLVPSPIGLDPLNHLPQPPWTTPATQRAGLILVTNLVAAEVSGNNNKQTLEALQRLVQVGCQLPPLRTERILMESVDKGHQILRSTGMAHLTIAMSTPVQPASQTPNSLSASHTTKQVADFQEISAHSTDINALLNSFMKALQGTLGLKRIALALLDPQDTSRLIGRYLIGADPAVYLPSFTGSLHTDHPFFLSILKRTDPLVMPNLTTLELGQLSPDFLSVWQPRSCVLGPIRINRRPIGLIYGDFGPRTATLPADVLVQYQLFYTPLAEGLVRLTKR